MIARFIKANPVFVIAGLFAIISMFLVPPNAGYASYIDWRTVSLLLCQLMIVQGLMESGFFRLLSQRIVSTVHTTRALGNVLILACFFSSMLVTNDVSLISFVPLTIILFSSSDEKEMLVPVVVLETIAANLGSMLMPFGNPQNLYLYNLSGISGIRFIGLMLPFTLVSLSLILLSCLFLPHKELAGRGENKNISLGQNKRLEGFGSLALLTFCILVVFHIGNVPTLLALSMVFFLFVDRNVFRKVNYILPMTFIIFFILTGNIQSLPGFSDALSNVIKEHEMITAVAVSQVISNVPAAMLLSSFTDNYKALIIGTDIGGLGTLIASMASLISFQFYCGSDKARPGKYIGVFTLFNVIYLIILLLVTIPATGGLAS